MCSASKSNQSTAKTYQKTIKTYHFPIKNLLQPANPCSTLPSPSTGAGWLARDAFRGRGEYAGLDAIDGTPVLDLKPVMGGFLPRGEIREPEWAAELMRAYW